MKKCTKCGIEKPLTEFHKHKETKDGLYGRCKQCARQYDKEYYAKNKEKIISYANKVHRMRGIFKRKFPKWVLQ